MKLNFDWNFTTLLVILLFAIIIVLVIQIFIVGDNDFSSVGQNSGNTIIELANEPHFAERIVTSILSESEFNGSITLSAQRVEELEAAIDFFELEISLENYNIVPQRSDLSFESENQILEESDLDFEVPSAI